MHRRCHLPFRRAALSFMRWQHRRGVLDPSTGSPWWRAVNERLVRDGCEAVARAAGRPGPPSSRPVALWGAFVARPAAETWYRAHNASIVSAYLEDYIRTEHRLGELLDHGVVIPRLAPLHRWSAAELGEPGLADLLDEGRPAYAWTGRDPDVWRTHRSGRPLVRLLRRALPAPE